MDSEKLRNDFFHRDEVKMEMESGKNPSFEEAAKAVADKEKKDVGLVVVKGVRNKFGSSKFLVEAYVYDSREDREKVEPKSKKDDQKEGEKKVEAPKEEAKPEEKQEEKKEDSEKEKQEEVKEEKAEAPKEEKKE